MSDPEDTLCIRYKGRKEETLEDFDIRAAIELLESSASVAIITNPGGGEVKRILKEHAINLLGEAKLRLKAECDPKTLQLELEALNAKYAGRKKRLNKVNSVLQKYGERNEIKQEAPAT